MFNIAVNYWAVLVATIGAMAIGALWYSPLLFAKKWMAYVKFQEKDFDKMKKSANKAYLLTFISTLLMSCILAHFLFYTQANNVISGITTVFWLWLGFVIPTTGSMSLFENRPLGLYLINVGHHLASMMVMGIILTLWK